jgi:CRP-like cAMP-binding protein
MMLKRNVQLRKHANANTTSFSDRNMSIMLEKMSEQRIKAGSHLFWEGEPADKLYLIRSGRIKITKSSDEGKELILHMYQPGDMFGQLYPFQSTVHSFCAKSIEDCVVYILNQKDLEHLIVESNNLAIDFMKWMAVNQRITETKLRDLMMYGKPGALCSTLIRLSNSYGKKEGDTIAIMKKLTHTELSNMIGATRESVNRLLNDLRKQDIIDYNNDSIVIKDLSRLQEICRCENCPAEVCRI